MLKPLYAAYETLKKARDARGPLDLDLPERKILLKADGTVDRVVSPERLESHRLIEEFMILANVAAAETLEQAHVPLIYRVHDEPSLEKVEALRQFMATLHINVPKGGAMRAEQFNRILDMVRGKDHEKLVNEVVLRSQSQAEYAAENYGHFGLNLRRYAHFTSPIRRYADLIVHRGLIRAGKFGDGGLAESQGTAELAEIAAQISGAERRAMKAERETNDRLIAHHLADRIGASFEGRISGVTRAGLFVKLDDTGADGFIPARTIGHEYFRYEEAMHAMVGNRSGETHRLGDRVTVKLVEAAPVAGALRFELLSEGRVVTAAQRRPSERPGQQDRNRAAARRPRTSSGESAADERPSSGVDAEVHVRRGPRPSEPDAEGCLDVDPARPQRTFPQSPDGQAPPAPYLPAGRVRLPWRQRRSRRPQMPVAAPLDPRAETKLMAHTRRPSADKARGLAVAAIRETFEETGLLLGAKRDSAPAAPKGPWQAFADAGILPDLSSMHFIARAITPPRRKRRYDTRFFTADVSAIAHKIDGKVGADFELTELVWLPLAGIKEKIELLAISEIVLLDLQRQIEAGFSHDLPVPFYRVLHGKRVRELL